MAFSDNLQFIRTQGGVTQEQLAEQLNVSRQSVSKWESGASFPEMDTLLRICDLYDVNMDTLLRGSVEESRVSDTARYNDFMNRFSLRMALSISAIIAGVALMILLCAFNPSDSFRMLAVALFMLIVTISVVVIVTSGIQYDNFRKKHPVIQDFYTEEEKDAFHQKFVWYIAGSVGAILFGVVLLISVFAFCRKKSRMSPLPPPSLCCSSPGLCPPSSTAACRRTNIRSGNTTGTTTPTRMPSAVWIWQALSAAPSC